MRSIPFALIVAFSALSASANVNTTKIIIGQPLLSYTVDSFLGLSSTVCPSMEGIVSDRSTLQIDVN